jgi:hypothetical protein
MDNDTVTDFTDRLKSEFRMYVLMPGAWSGDDLRHVGDAVGDLATMMGGPSRFRVALRWVLLWRAPFRTTLAAMAVPLMDVVYFQSASWGDPPELKWQTVHELGHVWDIRSFYRLSWGLKKASGASYGRFKRQFPIPFEYDAGKGWQKGRKFPLNSLEDWADAVAAYVYPDHAESARAGPRLISPARWNYVREQMGVGLAYPAHWIPHFHGPDDPGGRL